MMKRTDHHPATRYRVRPKSFATTTLLLTRRLDLAQCQPMQRGAILCQLRELDMIMREPLLTGVT